jgi:small-conductance mechanosensitive channel
MSEWIQRLGDVLDISVITLNEEPINILQIAVFSGTLAVALVAAGFLRRWFSRLFNRLRMSENIQNRLLALLFLVVIILGINLAFDFARINITLLDKIFQYPLADLLHPPQEDGTTANRLTLAGLFYAFLIILGMFILSKYAQWVLRQQVLQAFQIAEHTQFILLRFFHFSLIIIGILISLSTIGVSFTSLAIIFGGLSIGIGIGLQNIASNLVSGFILIFEHPIKIGDLVEIMDVNIFGRVGSINLRSTIIVALDEKEVIVPNSQLITESVHNLTHYNNRYRLQIPVGVSYSSDVTLVKKLLLEVAHAHPEIIKEPNPAMENVTAPFVRFTNFGESSLNFELLAWVPDCFQRFDIASDLHFMIWEKFKEHDIRIPFPQRDVHLYPTDTEHQKLTTP